MAHVLLPCDLPTWNDIQRHLAQLKFAKTSGDLIKGMIKICEICNISLEPEDLNQTKKLEFLQTFEKFENFLNESLSENDRRKFFDDVLPNLVAYALCLRLVKPQNGFLYSLKSEEWKFELDRGYVMSLLANCFFSTFPRRTPKTHPSLQNFAFCDFFQHLHRRSQQKKLKAFFRYFEKTEEKKKGSVCFHRKVLNSTSLPSLPGWLCSDRSLVPLVIRHEGNIHDSEPNVWRAFPCSSLIGGDVLQSATSPESSLFFAFPELLSCLSFLEKLDDNEAFVAHGVMPYGIHKRRQYLETAVTICLMDGLVEFKPDCDKQFEDCNLLRELNKAFVAFDQPKCSVDGSEIIVESQRRQTPIGESSSSEHPSASSSRRISTHKKHAPRDHYRNKLNNDDFPTRKCDFQEETNSQYQEAKTVLTDFRTRNYRPFIPVTSSSEEYNSSRYIPHCSETNQRHCSEFSKIQDMLPSSLTSSHPLAASASSSRSSTRSMKTASEPSLETPFISPILTTRMKICEDEYYTADEGSDKDTSDHAAKTCLSSQHSPNLSSLLKSTSSLVEDRMPIVQAPVVTKPGRQFSSSKDSTSIELSLSTCESDSKRSESFGFVLGGTASDDDIDEFAMEKEERAGSTQCHLHERLEDFRKRICRRTRRHLSRKMRSSSRSSYSLSSSTSSDMEDISEEEDSYYHHGIIRASNSEPSLFTANSDNDSSTLSVVGCGFPPFSPGADTVAVSVGGRRILVTSSSGQLKAYSYDGVKPNLPVPFRAKFRTRRSHQPSEGVKNNQNLYKDSRWLSMTEELSLGLSLSVDSDVEKSSHRKLSYLSSLPPVGSFQEDSFLQEYSVETVDDAYYDSKLTTHPIAVGPSKCGDPQLRALVLWLAASMTGLPSLIFYTGQESQLHEFGMVQRKVLSRKWTVGDLSCEVLRFCRNKLSPRRRSCASAIFEQILNSGTSSVNSSVSYSQQSLD